MRLRIRARLLAACAAAITMGGAMAESDTAEAFVTAFYSYDRASLQAMFAADADASAVLYYQAWAKAAHYEVDVRRPCRQEGEEWVCAITVNDDFGNARGYQATDTFRLRIVDDGISSATFAGDDPPVFEQVFAWIGANRPEVFAVPCLNMFAGGETPGDCARAIAQAARDFAAQKGSP